MRALPLGVPKQYDDRRFYQWAQNITLIRTTPEDNATIGRILAQKANQALFDAIKENLKQDIPVYELNCNINDDEFADAVVNKMLEFLQGFTRNS